MARFYTIDTRDRDLPGVRLGDLNFVRPSVFDGAIGLLLPGQPIAGFIQSPFGDVDNYAIRLKGGQIYKIEISAKFNGTFGLSMLYDGGRFYLTPVFGVLPDAQKISKGLLTYYFQAPYTAEFLTVFDFRSSGSVDLVSGPVRYRVSLSEERSGSNVFRDGGAGTNLADWIRARSGGDKVDGRAGDDTLIGGAGNDTLIGGLGNDLIFPGPGFDSIDGGSGFDTVSYARSAARIEIDLGIIAGRGDARLDSFTSIERFIGTRFADRMSASTYAVTFEGGDGNDTLRGGLGNDVLYGGSGNDRIIGGQGADTLSGGTDDDVLDGGAGGDTASYVGARSGVVVDLGVGGPQPTRGAGRDTLLRVENLIGSEHDDRLTGDGNRNRLEGGNGDDRLLGGGGNDILIGGTGHDRLIGGSGNDTLIGGLGNDLLDGGKGIDVVSYAGSRSGVAVNLDRKGPQNTGGEGRDEFRSIENVIGSSQDDRISGNSHANHLVGRGGNDTLRGGDGNDRLEGGDGDDYLHGGAGDDVLISGLGKDGLRGGPGADVFIFLRPEDSASRKLDTNSKEYSVDMDAIYDFESGVDKVDISSFYRETRAVSRFSEIPEKFSNYDTKTLIIKGEGRVFLSVDVATRVGFSYFETFVSFRIELVGVDALYFGDII